MCLRGHTAIAASRTLSTLEYSRSLPSGFWAPGRGSPGSVLLVSGFTVAGSWSLGPRLQDHQNTVASSSVLVMISGTCESSILGFLNPGFMAEEHRMRRG